MFSEQDMLPTLKISPQNHLPTAYHVALWLLHFYKYPVHVGPFTILFLQWNLNYLNLAYPKPQLSESSCVNEIHRQF